MKRRRIRRYKRPKGRNSLMKFSAIIGIILIAVACGYGTARFVLAPLLGYDTEVLKLDFPSKISDVISSKLKVSDNKDMDKSEDKDESGTYALQFGVFRNKSGALELKDELTADGIDVKIQEEDGKFKVISPLINTKEEAIEQLKSIETSGDRDVFITDIE